MKIVPNTPAHTLAVAASLRESDVQEIQAISGRSPEDALHAAVECSAWSFACVDDAGKPLAIFGLAPIAPGTASPWFLATDDLKEHSREFLRISRRWVEEISERYPVLLNYVGVHNTRALKWLRFVGFDIHPPVPYGVAGLPFHPIVLVS